MKNYIKRIGNLKNINYPLCGFLAIWLVINLIQSYFTELAHDEAYYWMYSKYLSWGYFDHPPMIALIIKIGYAIFNNELGVRFIICLIGSGTLLLLFKLIDQPDKKLYFFIILTMSIGMVSTHVCGWIAIPDTPVIFLVALFYYLYKIYLDNDSIKIAIIISVVIALMLYSKYHGVLVMFFTLISNINLVKRKSFWIIVTFSAILMIPHLIWQLKNDFPTFGYHLIGRSSSYELSYTTNYILGQLLISGPLVGFIIIYHAFGFKSSSPFEKSLKFNMIGTFIFFFISSFKGRVEPHWTAIAYIPLIILSYKSIILTQKAKVWVQRLFWPSIIFIFTVRAALIFDFLPRSWNLLKEFHGWDKWANEIKETAQGRKVVFTNKYQYPSKYTFYTGEFAHTLNNINYRKNQYDIWHFEDSIQDKSVMLIHSKTLTDTLETSNGLRLDYQFIDNFRSYYGIVITIIKDKLIYQRNSDAHILIMVENHSDKIINFKENKGQNSFLYYIFSRRGSIITSPSKIDDVELKFINPHCFYPQKIKIKTPEEPGIYFLNVSIGTGGRLPANNCNPIRIKII